MTTTESETDNDIYSTYSPEFAAIAREHEARIVDELSATPALVLERSAAVRGYQRAMLAMLTAATRKYPIMVDMELILAQIASLCKREADAAISNGMSRVENAERLAATTWSQACTALLRRAAQAQQASTPRGAV